MCVLFPFPVLGELDPDHVDPLITQMRHAATLAVYQALHNCEIIFSTREQ